MIGDLPGETMGLRLRPESNHRGSGRPKLAFSAATIISQARAISKPPPSARPLTAAMKGL